MAEVSAKVAQLTDTDIVRAFRDSLVALYPILRRLDCISDDSQTYDSFDEIAEGLWNVLVVDTLRWKNGLDAKPSLPPYGFAGIEPGVDGYIKVLPASGSSFRFIQFVGERGFGPSPFNAVEGVSDSGGPVAIEFSERVSFEWSGRRNA